MKAVIQRVKHSSVTVENKITGQIGKGILVLLGVAKGDTEADAEFLAKKITQLRIFEDEAGKMNLSAIETGAELLVVSQFTICGDCSKGRRPSFDPAAPPLIAEILYEHFIKKVKAAGLKVETGVFAAMMEVALLNDGPVTFIVNSRNNHHQLHVN